MKRVIIPMAVALLLVALLASTVGAQQFWTSMDDVWMNSLIVNKTATIGGALSVAGASSLTGDVAVTGGVSGATVAASGANTAGTYLVLTKQAAFVVTTSVPITPTGSYQPISSTAAVWTNSIKLGTAGQMLRLVNVGAQTITISDTGTLKLSGDLALGADDSLLLLSDGTNWVQMGTSNN